MISERTKKLIQYAQRTMNQALERNENFLVVDRFEATALGKDTYQAAFFYTNEIDVTVMVPSADVIVQVLTWFRKETNTQVAKFEDIDLDTNDPYRQYSLKGRTDDNPLVVKIRARFANGTCRFVEVPTGETKSVPAVAAKPAYDKPVTKRVLQCADSELPRLGE